MVLIKQTAAESLIDLTKGAAVRSHFQGQLGECDKASLHLPFSLSLSPSLLSAAHSKIANNCPSIQGDKSVNARRYIDRRGCRRQDGEREKRGLENANSGADLRNKKREGTETGR